jgi:hypothetical protein
MSFNFPEPDWKVLSRLRPLALDRLCRHILQEAGEILARAEEGKNHQTYLDLYRHIHKRDKVLSDCFDDWRRSQALFLLINWRAESLVTEEEFAVFSPETRDAVEWFLKPRN